jgi:hypothetical protein
VAAGVPHRTDARKADELRAARGDLQRDVLHELLEFLAVYREWREAFVAIVLDEARKNHSSRNHQTR